MHELNFREMTKEQLAEESLISLTYAILEEKRTSVSFNDLLKILKEIKGLKDAEIKKRLLQFYTDLNIDGRFLYNQENGWGLREWFKVEQIEETAPSVKTHKKKAKVVAEDDEDDLELDEEDIDFDEDFEEFVEEEIDAEKVDIDFDDDEEIDEEIDEDFIEEEEFDVEDEEEV